MTLDTRPGGAHTVSVMLLETLFAVVALMTVGQNEQRRARSG